MSRNTIKKILSKPRPIDYYDFAMQCQVEGYVYCPRAKRARDEKGKFVSLPIFNNLPRKRPNKSTKVKSIFSICRKDKLIGRVAEMFCIKEERRLRYEKRIAAIVIAKERRESVHVPGKKNPRKPAYYKQA